MCFITQSPNLDAPLNLTLTLKNSKGGFRMRNEEIISSQVECLLQLPKDELVLIAAYHR